VSGQHHAPAALYSRGKEPSVPIVQEAGWAPEPVWTQRLEEKSSASVGDRTPAVQSVVKHYTDWATPAHNAVVYELLFQLHNERHKVIFYLFVSYLTTLSVT
jgi:hypothetical protein